MREEEREERGRERDNHRERERLQYFKRPKVLKKAIEGKNEPRFESFHKKIFEKFSRLSDRRTTDISNLCV